MEQTPLKRDSMGKLLRTCLIVIILASIMAVARYVPVAANFTRVVASWQYSPWAPVFFCFLGIFYAAFGMPRQALCAVAGLIFGVMMGLSLAMAATLLGNLIDFYLAKIMRQRRNRDGQSAPPLRLWQKKNRVLRACCQECTLPHHFDASPHAGRVRPARRPGCRILRHQCQRLHCRNIARLPPAEPRFRPDRKRLPPRAGQSDYGRGASFRPLHYTRILIMRHRQEKF